MSQGNKASASSLRVIAPEQPAPTVGPIQSRRYDERNDLDDSIPAQLNAQDAKQVAVAYEISKLPLLQAATHWGLAPFLVQNLQRDNYASFFPIQALVIPHILASERYEHVRSRDICVSSPTGSGKTLAFVLPILQSLHKRRVVRLRALCVLPSRDLATQVYSVFQRYTEGSDLQIGLAIGQTDLEAEQRQLILGSEPVDSLDPEVCLIQYHMNPTNVNAAFSAFHAESHYTSTTNTQAHYSHADSINPFIRKGGRSAIDVLVCTPGRLMDHLEKTNGFTLQHLRFLVMDEADRLLNQSYQNWIGRVLQATTISSYAHNFDEDRIPFDPISWRQSVITQQQETRTSFCHPIQLRKLLFSATMTRDPHKLSSLDLIHPKFFNVHGMNHDTIMAENRYSLPTGLAEYIILCTAQQKPLVLLSLLNKDKRKLCVVFTSSVDSTHRLSRLLQLIWKEAQYGPDTCVAEFSSALNQNQRTQLLRRCTGQGDDEEVMVRILVCSDGMSRGMDLPNVSTVINYDIPSFAKTYVHRCGRTARGGQQGIVVNLIKKGQEKSFMKMRSFIESRERVQTLETRQYLVDAKLATAYKKCIKSLGTVLAQEKGV